MKMRMITSDVVYIDQYETQIYIGMGSTIKLQRKDNLTVKPG